MAADDDEPGLREPAPAGPEQIDAGHSRHEDVGDDDIRPPLLDEPEGLPSVAGHGLHRELVPDLLQGRPDIGRH